MIPGNRTFEYVHRQRIAEEARYSRSQRSALDNLIDKQRRVQADISNGHSPRCGLLRCHPTCPRLIP